MDEAVIPIECQYERCFSRLLSSKTPLLPLMCTCLLRKYSLSSSSLKPTWIPFMSTQAGVENLSFDMKLVTGEFLLGLKHSLKLHT